MKVFLDDVRNPPDDSWTVVRNVDNCVEILKSQTVTELSLDHDLGLFIGNREQTGYDVLLWLEETVYNNRAFPLPEKILVHSANPIGRRRMEDAICRIFSMRH